MTTASFIQRLETSVGARLSSEEAAALEAAVTVVTDVPADFDIARERDRKTESNVLLSGWACRYIGLADGRRQILALHIAGDMIDLHSFEQDELDHSIQSLTACKLGILPHEAIRRLTERHPHLGRVLWRSTLRDAVIARRWMVGLGQRSALEHTAHLFCEMHHRLRAADLLSDDSFIFPLNQTEMGEVLGISSVRTNRVLQELRARGVLSIRGQLVEVLDIDELAVIAEFDPTYLGLSPPAHETRS